jgi:outer membrane protein assembly factor BamB
MSEKQPVQTEAVEPPPASAGQARRAWLLTEWIAGVFAVLVGVGMMVGHVKVRMDDPLKSVPLADLKEKLRLNPGDEQLKQNIRLLDLELRRRYFRHLWRMNSGVWMLLGAAALFGTAGARVAHYQKRPRLRRPNPEAGIEAVRAAALARWSVAACGATVGAGLFAASLGLKTVLPERQVEAEKSLGDGNGTAPLASDAATLDELKRNWPRFRGAEGGGVSALANAPISWDVKTGAGVAWKTPVPASGFNSPITWGDRVFFSGGDAARREVFCLDAKTGQLLWRQPVANVPGSPAQSGEVPDTTGYAASTMASDGRRLYVNFANGDVAAFTFEGKLVWSKSFGPLKNPYGHAASLATWRDRLILQLDQGDNEEGRSKLYALDGRTGRVVWQTPRKVGASWATPLVIEAAGKPQVITMAVPWVIAYSAEDGAELWRVEGLDGEITPSPIFAGGLVFAVSPSEKLMAIRPDGQGDVTKTHVAWVVEDNVPDVTSPLSDGELVFTLTTSGMLTCLNAKEGKKQWEHDFEMEFHSSPGLAANHLYLLGQKGTAVVVQAGPQFKELYRTEMGDAFHASPAFAQDKIFLKGVTNIFCIEMTGR